MEARKNPEYLRTLQQAVIEFRDALIALLDLHVLNEGQDGLGGLARGIAPAAFPRGDADPDELAERRRRVGQASGRALGAVEVTGNLIGVQGAGPVDPIANWLTIFQPKPLLEATDILSACEQMIGRLDALALRAEAERPPSIGAEAMHPVVWGAASRLWRDGHFRSAVAAAAEATVLVVKHRTGRNDVAETSLWNEVFSDRPAQAGRPRLRWPGAVEDRDVITMNAGLRSFAPGVQMTIRNTAAHTVVELDEQVALEQLACLSLLARWVDRCELEDVGQQVQETPE